MERKGGGRKKGHEGNWTKKINPRTPRFALPANTHTFRVRSYPNRWTNVEVGIVKSRASSGGRYANHPRLTCRPSFFPPTQHLRFSPCPPASPNPSRETSIPYIETDRRAYLVRCKSRHSRYTRVDSSAALRPPVRMHIRSNRRK